VAASLGFHEGELAVQRRAGVGAQAARLSPMLAPPDLNGGASRFLGERDIAFMTARDRDYRLWTSPLIGAPGFLEGEGATLRIHATPSATDPLIEVPAGQPVGLLAIDFASRRRMRVNGTLTVVGGGELEIAADQAFGNCPQYIQQRRLDHGERAVAGDAAMRSSTTLTPEQTRLIEHADTFVLGTIHPERGADASHRGGTPGFVRVEGGELWWPDYPGNNMFNSLGNLAADGTAALLFIDFTSGATLHLSGVASIDWIDPGSAGDDGGTGRRIRLTPRHIVSGQVLPVRAARVLP
jgi:predicted pyridoxine 5'-phosphate oxidase superfamily flavin-nucleotide-binding protein